MLVDDLLGLIIDTEFLFECFHFVKDVITPELVYDINRRQMNAKMAVFLLQTFLCHGLKFFEEPLTFLINSSRFWSPAIFELFQEIALRLEYRDLIVRVLKKVAIPAGDVCRLLQIVEANEDELPAGIVDRLVFELDSIELISILSSCLFLRVDDFEPLFEFSRIDHLFVNYFLCNASPEQILIVRASIIRTNDVGLLVGCYQRTNDVEFLIRAFAKDYELRGLIQKEISEQSDEFSSAARRILDSDEGPCFVKLFEGFDFSNLRKLSIDENELYLVFRNCDPPSASNTIVQKAALILTSDLEPSQLQSFVGVDHLLKETILSIVFARFDDIPTDLALEGLAYSSLTRKALRFFKPDDLTLDFLLI
jgi:hypothetical protein